jgi:hypothetical protein
LAHHDDRNSLGRICGDSDGAIPSGHEYKIDFETNQLGRKLSGPASFPLCMPVLDNDVPAFYVAKLA